MSNIENIIKHEIHELYWNQDINCARTMLITLSKLMDFDLEAQLINAAIGMHGAGGYRAQCGLVEGSLMFISVYLKEKGIADKKISDVCYEFADEFIKRFSSLLCYDLRPGGFNETDPPHLCEDLTNSAILFTYQFLKDLEIKKPELILDFYVKM